MNLDELHNKLIAIARTNPPSENVPYSFEKRIMARLAAMPIVDELGFWATGLWRAVAPCVAITMLLGAWSVFFGSTKAPASDLSQEIDNTVMAAVDQEPSSDWVVR